MRPRYGTEMRFAILLMCGSLAAFSSASATESKVLLLGDSISIGYTPCVQESLAGKAAVSRPTDESGKPINCQYSSFGLSQLDAWLGDAKWDVIHFNWGIWDTHLLDAEGNIVAGEDVVVSDGNGGYVSKDGKTKIRSTPAQYRENLSKIVDRLEKTHARLIFATTTPMKSRRPENQFLIDVYNETAKKLMAERGIEIDDLNKLVAESGSDWYVEDGVHFAPAGSRELGKQVSATIVPAASSWLLVGICCTTIPVLVVPWRRMKKRNESAA